MRGAARGERIWHAGPRWPWWACRAGCGERGDLGWRVRHGPERARGGRELASGLGREVSWVGLPKKEKELGRSGSGSEAGWAARGVWATHGRERSWAGLNKN